MSYTIRNAKMSESVKIAKMLMQSLKAGVDSKFNINPARLHTHVVDVMAKGGNSCSLVLLHGDVLVGCFIAHLVPHDYCAGYIVRDLGVYIDPEHRGHRNFEQMFDKYLAWAESKPDVLMTTFTIGQLSATAPYLRAVLQRRGFTKGDEGYYRYE